MEVRQRQLKYSKMLKDVDKLQYPQGLRWTKQRKEVYRVLWEAAQPLSAVQIYHLAAQAECK